MSDRNRKSYLGDGVYANFDGYAVILTTEDGITTQNTIYLEVPVIEALQRYIATVYAVTGQPPADDRVMPIDEGLVALAEMANEVFDEDLEDFAKKLRERRARQ